MPDTADGMLLQLKCRPICRSARLPLKDAYAPVQTDPWGNRSGSSPPPHTWRVFQSKHVAPVEITGALSSASHPTRKPGTPAGHSECTDTRIRTMEARRPPDAGVQQRRANPVSRRPAVKPALHEGVRRDSAQLASTEPSAFGHLEPEAQVQPLQSSPCSNDVAKTVWLRCREPQRMPRAAYFAHLALGYPIPRCALAPRPESGRLSLRIERMLHMVSNKSARC